MIVRISITLKDLKNTIHTVINMRESLFKIICIYTICVCIIIKNRSAVDEILDELDESIKQENEIEMLENRKSELLTEMCKDLTIDELQKIKNDSRLCYYEAQVYSKYYQLKELSEEESEKYKDDLYNDDVNILQQLIKKIENDISNITISKKGKTAKENHMFSSDSELSSLSSPNIDEEMKKMKIDEIMYILYDSI